MEARGRSRGALCGAVGTPRYSLHDEDGERVAPARGHGPSEAACRRSKPLLVVWEAASASDDTTAPVLHARLPRGGVEGTPECEHIADRPSTTRRQSRGTAGCGSPRQREVLNRRPLRDSPKPASGFARRRAVAHKWLFSPPATARRQDRFLLIEHEERVRGSARSRLRRRDFGTLDLNPARHGETRSGAESAVARRGSLPAWSPT